MFTDLVGYSALAHRDEALAIELLELHRGWVREILPRHGGREIETVGDAFLIEFAGALAAVECAVALQRRFAAHNAGAPTDRRMELRIGIHLGDVEHKDGKVMGDGVNIASRIHALAEPGGICVSEDVHHAVRNRRGFAFASLGSPPLKNIATPLELFGLSGKQLAPAVPAALQTVPNLRPKTRRILEAAAGIAVVAALGSWFALRPPPGAEAPSVAVLPFDNLSAEPDSAYFTDGLHDTVIGHLARVRNLKVISRTSVMGYRGQQGNLRKIARELGVGHIVEGSVQRAGGRLRVAAQLIDTRTDAHVWSNEYDRELADVFAVQADIASQVAAAVHAKLTPQEQARIEAVPTKSPAAYDLYLRAVLVERMADPDPAQIRQAIGWLDEAVALDPNFALAYALRAYMHDLLYWFGHDPSDARRALVGESAEAALRLDAGLAEAHVARALHLYHGSRRYEDALRELEVARGIAPGSAKVHFWLAPIYRRQGRWDEALASVERGAALDPLNEMFLREHAGTLQLMRRYAEADAVFARLGHLTPDNKMLPIVRAYGVFLRTGETAPVARALGGIPADFNPGCQISFWRMGLALMERRFDDAVSSMRACPLTHVPSGAGEQQLPRDYFVAVAEWLGGERKRSATAQQTLAQIEALLVTQPDQAGVRMALAYTLAMLGERRRALEETDRALKAMPLSRDALMGTQILKFAADVHAIAGAEERAVDELEQLLRLPGGPHAHEVRLDPAYDTLRALPRFQKLIAEHLPKTG
jgi:TolB-like protein/class 3 adenylate cyclase/Tfp pilus assembly protein PilF